MPRVVSRQSAFAFAPPPFLPPTSEVEPGKRECIARGDAVRTRHDSSEAGSADGT